MNFENTPILLNFFENVDIYMLIFIRVGAMLSVMPIIGGKNTIAITRIGLGLVIASIIYSSDIQFLPETFIYNSTIEYGILVVKEIFVGLIIGYVTYFIFNAAYLAGFFTDQQIGYAMANMYDPTSRTQIPITGNLYYFAICVLFIINKGHYLLINSIFYSFKAIPISTANLIGNGKLFYIILNLIIEFFKIGLSIALPIFGVILVIDIALGVMVKAVPKMNVFIIGMPAKALVGLIAIWIILPVFSQIYYRFYSAINDIILNAIKVMM